jgi:hypothetical protein
MKSLLLCVPFVIATVLAGNLMWMEDGSATSFDSAVEQNVGFTRPDQYAYRYRSVNKFSGKGGHITIRMKMSNLQPGTISAFYIRTHLPDIGESDGHDEADLEFGGGRNSRQVWTAIYEGGPQRCGWTYDLPFDVTEDYHYYTIAWESKNDVSVVELFVDGCFLTQMCVKGAFEDFYALVTGWIRGRDAPAPQGEFCWLGRLHDGSDGRDMSAAFQVVDSSADVTGAKPNTKPYKYSRKCTIGSRSTSMGFVEHQDPGSCSPTTPQDCSCKAQNIPWTNRRPL